MATRSRFDESADQAAPVTVGAPARRPRFSCAAHGCPMAGTLFLGSDGVCGWHAREQGGDWPRITQVLNDWACVNQAINSLTRVLNTPDTCADPKTQNAAMLEAWTALAEAVHGSGWKQRLEPQKSESIGSWVHRLRLFLGARVKESFTGGAVDETKPTPFVAEVCAGLRSVPLASRNNVDPFA